MYDHFFTMEFLIWVKARLGMQLKALQVKEKAGTLTEKEADQKAVVEQAYDVDVFDLADRAEDAKLIVRGERFYQADKLEGALNCFRRITSYNVCYTKLLRYRVEVTEQPHLRKARPPMQQD